MLKTGDKVEMKGSTDRGKVRKIGKINIEVELKNGVIIVCQEKDVKPRFLWKKFKKGKFAVHCKTEEEAKDFFKHAKKHGCTWTDGFALKTSETNWQRFEENTCYDCENDMLDAEIPAKICYTYISSYKKDYKVLKWSDYMEG